METSASDNPVKESGVLALDSTKAMHYLGWRPIWPTMEAINETADWYRDFLDGKDVVDITATQLARFVAGS
jgi:CDP-glucose 4,6-dehydratase